MEACAVEVDDLHKAYRSVVALAGVSFRVRSGQVLALLGPNGAGKTTTVEVCEGYRHPDAGRVRVLGLDPFRDHRRLAARVGVMLQEPGGYPGARAGELLELIASFYRDPLPPRQLLESLGLADAARTPFRRLSGGQRQRLSLACALVGRPEVTFLDEPTAGLDVQARHATWELIARLRADGVAVVLTTHAMEEVEHLADEVVIIDHGRVVATGTPEGLTRREAGGQLRFRSRPGLELSRLLRALPAGARGEESPAGHYVLDTPVTPALLAAVTAWCAGEGALVEDLHADRPTLEEVFLELTGHELRP